MLVVPNAQLLTDLDAWATAIGSVKLGLFNSAITPSRTTALSDFTGHIPTWATATTLTGLSSATIVSGKAVVTWDPISFTNSTGSPVNIYGYFVTDSAGTILRWAESAPGAPISVPPGSQYTVNPYYSRDEQT